MYILGYNWFELNYIVYNKTEIWKIQNVTGRMEVAWHLGNFCWFLIAFCSLLLLIAIFFLIKLFYDKFLFDYFYSKEYINECENYHCMKELIKKNRSYSFKNKIMLCKDCKKKWKKKEL